MNLYVAIPKSVIDEVVRLALEGQVGEGLALLTQQKQRTGQVLVYETVLGQWIDEIERVLDRRVEFREDKTTHDYLVEILARVDVAGRDLHRSLLQYRAQIEAAVQEEVEKRKQAAFR